MGRPATGAAAALRLASAERRELQPVDALEVLEEDRPVQIVFALDLSGSMSTEREAVRRAIREFAETFRFRGRDAAFGLVTFSDELRDRRAPTRRPEEFGRWLELLGDAKGGAFENTTGALAAASALLGRSPAERVVVLLTDEPMQSGSSGVIAAARRTRACTPVFRLLETYAACGTASCRLAAARRVGGPIAVVIDACVNRLGAAFCDRQLDPGVLGESFAACVGGDAQYVRSGSRELRDLAASLSSRAVRPFMILPHELSEGGPFVDLARSLDGQVHPVDDDSTDSATFMRPLLAIADQLSKQYVLRYRPEDGDGAARPQVLVRLDHEWNGWGESARAATLVPLAGSSASCPELAALSPGGTLHRSRECGRRFEGWAPGGVGPVDAIAPGPGGATGSACALVAPERRVCGDGSGPSRALDVVGVDPRRVTSGPGEALAVPGVAGAFLWATSDGAVLRTTDSGGHFREVLGAGDSPWRLAVVPAARALVCAASARAVRCSEDLGLSWFAAGADLEVPSATVALGAAGGQVFLDRGDRLRRLTRVVNRDIPSSAVYFETASDAPRATIQPFLAALGRTLAASSELVLRVEGHADRRGDDAYNDDLARRRAERIADAVVAAGGRRSQVEVASYGSRRPIRPGSDPESLARNRRVELVLLEPMSIAAVPAERAAPGCPADDGEPGGGDGGSPPATVEDPSETPSAPDDEPDAAAYAPEEEGGGGI